MENRSPQQHMLAQLRQSQQSLLDLLSQADERLLYQRSGQDEWTLAENLVHLAEARAFFVAETRKALVTPNITIGRTVTHPGRLQNVTEHGLDTRECIAQHLATSHALVLELIEQLSEDDLQKTGEHV